MSVVGGEVGGTAVGGAGVNGADVDGSEVGSAAAAVVHRLAERHETLATVESLTGGSLAAAIVNIAGVSGIYRGGLVVYATELKSTLAGVPADLLSERGPVDPEVAAALAEGAGSGAVRTGGWPPPASPARSRRTGNRWAWSTSRSPARTAVRSASSTWVPGGTTSGRKRLSRRCGCSPNSSPPRRHEGQGRSGQSHPSRRHTRPGGPVPANRRAGRDVARARNGYGCGKAPTFGVGAVRRDRLPSGGREVSLRGRCDDPATPGDR